MRDDDARARDGDCDSARSADPRIARVAARPPTVVSEGAAPAILPPAEEKRMNFETIEFWNVETAAPR